MSRLDEYITGGWDASASGRSCEVCEGRILSDECACDGTVGALKTFRYLATRRPDDERARRRLSDAVVDAVAVANELERVGRDDLARDIREEVARCGV